MNDLQIIREALEGCQDFIANMESTGFGGLALFEYINEAIDSIERIEKQEPVAWMDKDDFDHLLSYGGNFITGAKVDNDDVPLYSRKTIVLKPQSCGACGDSCINRGGCRLESESPSFDDNPDTTV